MEIEKPFKCPTCSARFTNEDHLFVHKRRHEMSLNLKSGGIPAAQTSLDSFVDETPTPTRFFRNCEEVGLFQDLQNVNPFDESFAKASSTAGTPSLSGTGTGGVDQFDFSIALPSSATVVPGSGGGGGGMSSSASSDYSLASKRRASDQDTLNTPQIFLRGYNLSTSTPTATHFSATTTTVLNPVPEGGKQGLSLGRTDEKDEKVKDDSCKPRAQKPKTSLKLNLSPITSMILSDVNTSAGDRSKFQKLGNVQEPEKKTELLERNRAASSRSRQRRKHWVSSLESRCETLEKLLAQTKAENQILQSELIQTLAKHANCDVTKSQNTEIQVQKDVIQIVLVQSKSIEPSISSPQIPISDTLPGGTPPSPRIVIPKTKIPAKRGRPRKGQERRVQGFSAIFPNAMQCPTPAKLPLAP